MQLFIMNAFSARLVHFVPRIHAGKFIILSLIPIIVFCVLIESFGTEGMSLRMDVSEKSSVRQLISYAVPSV